MLERNCLYDAAHIIHKRCVNNDNPQTMRVPHEISIGEAGSDATEFQSLCQVLTPKSVNENYVSFSVGPFGRVLNRMSSPLIFLFFELFQLCRSCLHAQKKNHYNRKHDLSTIFVPSMPSFPETTHTTKSRNFSTRCLNNEIDLPVDDNVENTRKSRLASIESAGIFIFDEEQSFCRKLSARFC